MVKKLLLCVVLVMAMVSSAFGEAELCYEGYCSIASLKNGKADYSNARFGCSYFFIGNTGLILTKDNIHTSGTITLSGGNYSFWDGTKIQKVSGTSKTFKLMILTGQELGEEAEFWPFTDIGGEFGLGIEAEDGMNGVTLSWNFPDMPSLNGTYTIPNYLTTQEQMNKHVVYFEFIRSGENVTGINWRIVKASDTSTPVVLDYPVNFNTFAVRNYDYKSIYYSKTSFDIEPGQIPEGTLSFDSPIKESDIWYVSTALKTYDEEVEKGYYWEYCKSSEMPELYLWTRHASDASLVNGKSDYATAKFSDVGFYIDNDRTFICEEQHLTDTGRITIPGGGYTIKDAETKETLGTAADGTDITLRLRNDSDAFFGKLSVEYQPISDNGRRIVFGGGADTGLNGKTISWTFPAELAEFNGSGVVPNYRSTSEQLASGVPYIEVVSEDGYITAVNYKIVRASDTSTAITPSYDIDFAFIIERADTEDLASTRYESGLFPDEVSGTWILETPQPLSTMKRICAVLYTYEENGTDEPSRYRWNFYPASASQSSGGSSSSNCSAGFTLTALFLTASLFLTKKR